VLAALESRLLVAVLNSIKAWIRHQKLKSLADWSSWIFLLFRNLINDLKLSRLSNLRTNVVCRLRHRKSGNIVLSVSQSHLRHLSVPKSFIHQQPELRRKKSKKVTIIHPCHVKLTLNGYNLK
jgi:hypothetical protein